MDLTPKSTHQALCILFLIFRAGICAAHSSGLTKIFFPGRLQFKGIQRIKHPGVLNHLTSWGILVLAGSLLTPACKSDSHSSNQAHIQFNQTLHDFGTVAMNTKVSHDFVFTNPGEETLMIQDIQTSCGCTVPQWPQKPIQSGEKENIHIVFDADFPGAFSKTITVYYNGKNSPDTLYIKGEVERTKTAS